LIITKFCKKFAKNITKQLTFVLYSVKMLVMLSEYRTNKSRKGQASGQQNLKRSCPKGSGHRPKCPQAVPKEFWQTSDNREVFRNLITFLKLSILDVRLHRQDYTSKAGKNRVGIFAVQETPIFKQVGPLNRTSQGWANEPKQGAYR